MTRRALIVVALLAAGGGEALASAPTVLRIATEIPDNTDVAQLLRTAAFHIENGTEGRVQLEVQMGRSDAHQIARMRDGEIQGAFLLRGGTLALEADTAALMLPLLGPSAKEWDAIVAAAAVRLDALVAANGYVALGWVPLGWVRVAAESPIVIGGQLASLAHFGWPVHGHFLGALGISKSNAKEFGLTETTVEIARTLSLFKGGGHVLAVPVGRAYGVLVVREDALSALRKDDRAMVERVLRRAATGISLALVEEDDAAYKALLKAGMVEDSVKGREADLEQAALATYQWATGTLVTSATMQVMLSARSSPAGSPKQVAATKAKPAPRPPAPASNALAAAAAKAPDHLRALWLAFDECDASMLSLFVQFPVAIGSARFTSAKALAKACKAGALAWPSAAALEAALPGLQVGDRGATLVVGKRTLRLEWQAQSWMLAGAE